MRYKDIPFSDLLETIIDNRGRTCPVQETGIPLIATNCIKDNTLYPVFEKVRYVSQETYYTWFRGHPKPEDIIFVLKGSPGRVNWVPDPINFCIAQDMVALRANKNLVDPKYLFALLKSKSTRHKIENMHVGSLIPHFKKGDFNKLLLPIPESLEYQRKIGEIYFSFYDKIELNRKMNETLEAMAQALFKSWFVDFDPVHLKARCKSEEEIEAGAKEHGISKEVLELFPSEFVESEMGMIPLGWEVSTIEHEVTIYGGATPSTKEEKYWIDGDNHWVTPRDLSGLNSKVLIDTGRKITDDGVNKISSKQLPIGTVLLSSRAPVGYIAYSTVPISINQGFIAMVCKKRLSNYFIMYWLDIAMNEIKNRAIGTTFSEISKSAFRPIKLVVASDEVITAFDVIVAPMVKKIIENECEIETLQQTRDTLLPKLLSGELDVSHMEVA